MSNKREIAYTNVPIAVDTVTKFKGKMYKVISNKEVVANVLEEIDVIEA